MVGEPVVRRLVMHMLRVEQRDAVGGRTVERQRVASPRLGEAARQLAAGAIEEQHADLDLAHAWRAPRGEEVSIIVTDVTGKQVLNWTGASDGEGTVSVDASERTYCLGRHGLSGPGSCFSAMAR